MSRPPRFFLPFSFLSIVFVKVVETGFDKIRSLLLGGIFIGSIMSGASLGSGIQPTAPPPPSAVFSLAERPFLLLLGDSITQLGSKVHFCRARASSFKLVPRLFSRLSFYLHFFIISPSLSIYCGRPQYISIYIYIYIYILCCK